MGNSQISNIQLKYKLFNARTDFSKILEDITLKGGKRLRDSICVGLNKVIELNRAIPRNDPDLDFHFIHILLTNGQDTNSKIDMPFLSQIMRVAGDHLDKKMITNHFIGIDLTQEVEQELRVLSTLAENKIQFHLASSTDSGKIFHQIQVPIEAQRKEVKNKRFIVVFNMDVSESMTGSMWKEVRKAVDNFIFAFKENDLFSFILFNEDVREINPNFDQMFVGDTTMPFDQLKLQPQQEAKRREQNEGGEEERIKNLRKAEEEKRSMAGQSWNQVREAVSKFTLAFNEDDLFSIILFISSINELSPSEDQMFGGDRTKSLAELRTERSQAELREKQLESIQIEMKKSVRPSIQINRNPIPFRPSLKPQLQIKNEEKKQEQKKDDSICPSYCTIY